MRATGRAMAGTGLLLMLAAGGVAGQTRLVLGVGAGALLPGKSSFGDNVNSVGYHGQLMLGIAPPAGKISIRFDGQYGSVNYDEQTIGVRPKVKMLVLNADLVLHPSSGGSVRPYLLLGPTYGRFSYRSGTGSVGDETTNGVGVNGGAGLNLGNANKIWFFTEARYVYTKEHRYIPITIGIRINTR